MWDANGAINMKKTFHIGISGSYGGLNLGDEAILQSITSELRSRLPVEITVFSPNAEDTLRRHRAVAPRQGYTGLSLSV